jgi:lysophospholipase L1-like esterase
MSSLVIWTLLLTSLLPGTSGYAVNRASRTGDNRTTKPLPLLQSREDGDPTDYSWVKSLADIGDSFTAGIGAGNNIGGVYDNKKANGDRDSYACSRYDMSYPMLVNRVIGPSVKEFQFPACSGDRSGRIFDQVNALKEDIDMVVMTAGGNDLCLVSALPKMQRCPCVEPSTNLMRRLE